VKRRIAVLAATAAAAIAAPAAAPINDGFPGSPADAVARSCSSGFKHAVINGAEKCLRRGQFCAHAADRQYRRYGYRCTSRDIRGNYHLT
jgi:hypothetical protein